MKRIESRIRQIDLEIERRSTKRKRDADEFKVVENVIDPPTLKVLYRLLNRGILSKIHGVLNSGKEANVYRGENMEGKSVAVKIYRMSTASSNYMYEYIRGDRRFVDVPRQVRHLIPQWALKEYKNLQKFHESGVAVPRPIDVERNVLVMEFIGDADNGIPAPLLRDVKLESPVDVFDEIMNMIELSYKKAGLVHADLSEYNIMWRSAPVFIDVSQSVLNSHPSAERYLFRDIQNIINYFSRLGVETPDPQNVLNEIISNGDTGDVIPSNHSGSH